MLGLRLFTSEILSDEDLEDLNLNDEDPVEQIRTEVFAFGTHVEDFDMLQPSFC